MRIDDRLGDGKPQSASAAGLACLIGPIKAIEGPFDVFGRYADSRIGHANVRAMALKRSLDLDGIPFFGVLDRVIEHDRQQLAQLGAISRHHGPALRAHVDLPPFELGILSIRRGHGLRKLVE